MTVSVTSFDFDCEVSFIIIRQELCRILVNLEISAEMYKGKNFLNFMFYGPAGTGKTTVARVVGKVLKLSGILYTDIFQEISPQDLKAQYLGQTAALVSQTFAGSAQSVVKIRARDMGIQVPLARIEIVCFVGLALIC